MNPAPDIGPNHAFERFNFFNQAPWCEAAFEKECQKCGFISIQGIGSIKQDVVQFPGRAHAEADFDRQLLAIQTTHFNRRAHI